MGQDPVDDVGEVGAAAEVREAFETMPLGLVSYGGPDNRFVAANAVFREFVARSGVIGRPLRDVLVDLAGQHVIELVEQVYRTGAPQMGREWRIQLTPDDGPPRERFITVGLFPRRGPGGAVVGVNGYLVEVTDEVVARRAAQARAGVAERRYERARDVIGTLQRALLPAGLPVLPGARIAASYLLADGDEGADGTDGPDGTGVGAGGDWFDAVPRPGGRVALVVGDVVGHGVSASAVMGQLRAVLADRLDDGADLATALGAVERLARRVPGARAATVCVAELDPADGSVTYCTAGHPPPLLVPPTGEARYLPATGAGPLGTGTTFHLATAHLRVEELLLLYSDGIIERPGRFPAAATVELAQVAAHTAAGRSLRTGEDGPPERVCVQTLELLVRTTGHTDDITLLAVQRVPAPAALEVSVPAGLPAVRDLRSALRTWLDALAVAEDDVVAVQHAVGELVTNAVEHAYPRSDVHGTGATADDVRDTDGADAVVTLRAALGADGVLHVEVGDRGRWYLGDSGPDRGRGLAMSRELIDTLDIDRAPHGTTAALTRRLRRPARLLSADQIASGTAAAPRARPSTELLILDRSTAPGADAAVHLRVEGPVDVSTAVRLHRELLQRTRGGTRALTLDLAGVTHLASAGVAVLHDAVRTSTRNGAALEIRAPLGSVAQHVLALVALPHTTGDPGPPAQL